MATAKRCMKAHRDHAYQYAGTAMFNRTARLRLGVALINYGWLMPWAFILVATSGYMEWARGHCIAYCTLSDWAVWLKEGKAGGRSILVPRCLQITCQSSLVCGESRQVPSRLMGMRRKVRAQILRLLHNMVSHCPLAVFRRYVDVLCITSVSSAGTCVGLIGAVFGRSN